MMPLDLDEFATYYRNVIEDMPQDTASDDPPQLTFGDDTVDCCRSGTSETHDLDVPGFIRDYDEEVMCIVADFTTLPEPGESVTLEGTTMKVERTMKSPDGMAVHLFLTGI